MIDSPASLSESCDSGDRCPLCPFMQRTSVLPKSGIPIFGRFECRSSNVVYIVHCTQCHMQYVGETGGELRQRFRGHLQLIKEGKGALGEHFRACRTWPLERQPPMVVVALQGGFWLSATRKAAEKRWIEKLGTLSPRGLNRNKGTVLRNIWAKLFS